MGLVYLVALTRKMAKYVAAELEKYFGFVGYPNIFHTGTYTIVVSLFTNTHDFYPHQLLMLLSIQFR